MRLQMFFQFSDPVREFSVCSHFSRKRTKARTTKTLIIYCLFRVEHRRCHDCAMFGEGIWQRPPSTAICSLGV